MVKSYYRPGAERGPQVHALFATIADRYDLINDLQSLGMHRHWKRRLVSDASVGTGQNTLDVCTGTGDIAFRLEAAGAQTVGVDFSLPMLRVARRRSRSLGLSIPLLAADGLRLPFVDAAFDRVTIGYGLRNLPDFKAALLEFHRVTRPGGRLLVLDFGKPTQRLWRGCYFAYLRLALPVLGRVFCGDAAAYAYILESLRHYPDQHAIVRLLETTGWQDVRATNFLGGIMSLHSARRSS
jgi:demethylmenaquinone methyltransferase/2-methoxy-6-polyprenyl-1,4-benzoquinol methylase